MEDLKYLFLHFSLCHILFNFLYFHAYKYFTNNNFKMNAMLQNFKFIIILLILYYYHHFVSYLYIKNIVLLKFI